MTRRCKDCKVKQLLYAAEQSEQEASEIITELKQDLALFRQAHDNEQAQRRILKQKLERIKEIAEECSLHNACISDCAYFDNCDGCVTNLFLQIIEGAEDE